MRFSSAVTSTFGLATAVFASLSSSNSAFEHGGLVQRSSASLWKQRNLQREHGSLTRRSRSRSLVNTRTIPQSLISLRAATNGEDSSSQPPSKRSNPVTALIRNVLSWKQRIYSRFMALPKRAKRLVLIQWMLVLLLCGAISKKMYTSGAPAPPVEVSYSKFLDLVEQQQARTTTNSEAAAPRMDFVRIGTDRIVYRLYPAGTTTAETPITTGFSEAASLSEKTVSSGRLAREKVNIESLNSELAQRIGRIPKRKRQQPYITAYTRKVPASPELVSTLRQYDISFAAESRARASVAALTLRSAGILFYFLILWRLYSTVSGAGGNSKSDVPGKLAQASNLPLANFDEIQGIDDVKQEVMELVDTIRNPQKYAMLGARAPTGILLEGPSGTGKTLLARATAATAGVPLIYCSGSDFVEMFVGRGAARVRKLFERATKLAPCIIFIDELDALGKSRDMGGAASFSSRSNDEAEQTLNQLLACMDGLDSTRGISVLAATNRRDVLDPALVRPGRFDRIVQVKLPDAVGREKILRVHCRKLPGFVEVSGVDPDRPGALGKGRRVDLSAIAAVTAGLSGAELEFIVNEAAIRAVRRVSAALHKGVHQNDITPHVEAVDFEASVANFFATRKPNNSPANIFKNLMK